MTHIFPSCKNKQDNKLLNESYFVIFSSTDFREFEDTTHRFMNLLMIVGGYFTLLFCTQFTLHQTGRYHRQSGFA